MELVQQGGLFGHLTRLASNRVSSPWCVYFSGFVSKAYLLSVSDTQLSLGAAGFWWRRQKPTGRKDQGSDQTLGAGCELGPGAGEAPAEKDERTSLSFLCRPRPLSLSNSLC